MSYALLVKTFLVLWLAPRVKSSGSIYVSQISGKDRASCGSQSSPCRTISRAITQASTGWTIYLDGTNTTRDHFKCQPPTSQHNGIYVNKSLSFAGFRSRAHVACDVEQSWVINGTSSSRPVNVTLSGLVFKNSRLCFIETSAVAVSDCLFFNTEGLVMNFTTSKQNNLALSFDNVAFESNDACVQVAGGPASGEQKQIHIDIRNSVFDNNAIRLRTSPDALSVTSSLLSMNYSQIRFLEVTVKNSIFRNNVIQADGMMYLRNELGRINLLIENSTFTGNGRNGTDIDIGNSLFVLRSRNIAMSMKACRAVRNEARLGSSISLGFAQISVSTTTADDFTSAAKHGGLLYIRSNTLRLVFQNCSFNNGRLISGHGGAVYTSGKDTSIAIDGSSFTNMTCSGNGGVFHVEMDNRSKTLANLVVSIKNSSFANNSAHLGGVMRFYKGSLLDIVLQRTIFERNTAYASGGVLFRDQQKTPARKGSHLRLTVTDSTFFQNKAAKGYGGAVFVNPSDSTCLHFHNVSFEENMSEYTFGGALFLGERFRHENGTAFTCIVTNSHFHKNSADNGGALAVLQFTNYKSTTLSFKNAFFTQNEGGAVYFNSLAENSYAYVHFKACFFTRNGGERGGGGIYSGGRGSISITDSIFRSNAACTRTTGTTRGGGALLLQHYDSIVSIENTTFANNSCKASQGGAVYLQPWYNSEVTIIDCTFKNNNATRARGGGLFIQMSEDKLNQSGCEDPDTGETVPQRSWVYNNTVRIRNTLFEGNVALGGGAMSVVNGDAILVNCNFTNNFAPLQGGHVSNDGNSSLKLVDCIFLQTFCNISVCEAECPSSLFIQTYSPAPLVLRNSTLDARTCFSNVEALIMVSKGGLTDFDQLSTVVCPVGSYISPLNLSYPNLLSNKCIIKVTVLRLSCKKCNPGFYSLQRGHTKGLTIVNDFQCTSCPHGADCFPAIKSKPNFWGYLARANPPTLQFTLCPLGYCRAPKQHSDVYNSCHGNRNGFMCGVCSSGYSEGLFSTECGLVKNCSGCWFWLVSVLLVLGIALFFIYNPPVVQFAVRQVLWFKRRPAGEQRPGVDRFRVGDRVSTLSSVADSERECGNKDLHVGECEDNKEMEDEKEGEEKGAAKKQETGLEVGRKGKEQCGKEESDDVGKLRGGGAAREGQRQGDGTQKQREGAGGGQGQIGEGEGGCGAQGQREASGGGQRKRGGGGSRQGQREGAGGGERQREGSGQGQRESGLGRRGSGQRENEETGAAGQRERGEIILNRERQLGYSKDKKAKLPLSEVDKENGEAEGFLEIVFYFYQISNLLLTSTSVEKLVKTKLILPVVGLFNFQQRFSNGGQVCPFSGLTPQTKKLLEVLPVFGTLVAIYVIYAIHRCHRWVLKRPPLCFGPYLAATTETLLLGYATVADVTLSLVRCVPVGSDHRWFYNGTVVCYQWWQYIMISVNVLFVVPFMFALAWGTLKLHHGKISAKELQYALVVPLPFLIIWVARCLRGGQYPHVDHNSVYIAALKNVLHDSFRKPKTGAKGALYWQSVLIGRRFVLVFLHCFITNSSIRLLCMTLVCVLACLHHAMVKPFRNPHVNTAETVSLLSLILLAAINMYKSFALTTGVKINGPLVSVFEVFDWIEIVLLGFLPTVFLLLIILAAVSLMTRLLITCWGRVFVTRLTPACFMVSMSNEDERLLNTSDGDCGERNYQSIS